LGGAAENEDDLGGGGENQADLEDEAELGGGGEDEVDLRGRCADEADLGGGGEDDLGGARGQDGVFETKVDIEAEVQSWDDSETEHEDFVDIPVNVMGDINNSRYKYTFGTQTFSESSMWYPNFRNVQFGTPIF